MADTKNVFRTVIECAVKGAIPQRVPNPARQLSLSR